MQTSLAVLASVHINVSDIVVIAFFLVVIALVVLFFLAIYLYFRDQQIQLPKRALAQVEWLKAELERIRPNCEGIALTALFEHITKAVETADQTYQVGLYKESLDASLAARINIEAFEELLSRKRHPTNPENF